MLMERARTQPASVVTMWRMIRTMNHAATPAGSGTPPGSGTLDGAEDRQVADDPAGGPESTHDPQPWADAARPRGLDAYFAPGGEDEAPPERVADERRLTRLLILMVFLLVGVPTLLTLVAFAVQLASLRPGG